MLYNRGMISAALVVESIRSAQKSSAIAWSAARKSGGARRI